MKIIDSPCKIPGGVHPDPCKALAAGRAVARLPVPPRLVISMSQHLGAPARCLVKPGDVVSRGQLIGEKNGFLSVCVRASAAGVVTAVETRPGAAGNMAEAVVLDTTAPGLPPPSGPVFEPLDPRTAGREALLARIEAAGVCGMGGAGFPTRVKLDPPPGKRCDVLILNGAECEPYLTADDRLMIERADRLRAGAEILRAVLGGPAVRIAIEANKREAIDAVARAFEGFGGDVAVVVLPERYPYGSEKHQIYAVTGRVVPAPPALPIDVGCVVENVATAVAVADAVEKGEPLLERIVTVSGDAVAEPGNVLAPCGTPYADLVAFCGGASRPVAKIVSGGAMMGFAVPSLEVATAKTTSGLLLLSRERTFQYSSHPCINCGRCVRACPMRLNAAEIGKAVEADDVRAAEARAVMSCIECGACSFVCPAYRPLTQFCRRAKNSIRARLAAESAKARAAKGGK